MGLEQFNRGNYGISQRYFKDAVEKAPRDVTAWVGLAASYDRLRRFDLADQAYAAAIRLGGESVQILNDQGYSYMLRGNLTAARRKFEKAYSLDPTNPVIANNLELLNGSRRFIERAPNNQP
jgi:Flp pilus assembly protein TadD